MKKLFSVSLCHKGILGGWIVADDEAITYKTGKLTVDARYRDLQMRYEDIQGLSEGWALCFPTVTVHMNNGEAFKFIVYARKKFLELIRPMISGTGRTEDS